MENFKKLGLSEETLSTLKKKGFEEPTEIQKLIIPVILNENKDIIAQAQTGTGKTAAFALPLIERLKPSKKVQAIIIAPTRELVIQVTEEINSLKGKSKLETVTVYGGQSIELQLKKLKRGVDIVVGTPGRVIDHIKRKTLDLSSVKFFILDEADEMLNMGFIEDIETIFKETPQNRRVMLFSATMPERIKKLAQNYMSSYLHKKAEHKLTTELTEQIYFEINEKDKLEALTRIIDIEPSFYGIVFCRTKVEVDDIVAKLTKRGYFVDGLHGDISQAQRERTLKRFRQEIINILIATDVAARGIDIDNLTHVINYSIPQNPEAYVHRIGRTGRAGKKGTAITFVTPSEFRKLGFIKRITNTEIRKEYIPKVKEIIDAKKEKIENEISENLKNRNDFYINWAKKIINENKDIPFESLMATVLKMAYGEELDTKNYGDIKPVKRKEKIKLNGKTRLFIAKGTNNGINKKSLIDLITQKTQTPSKLIKDIVVHENFSFITVPFEEAEIILKAFKRKKGRPIVEEAKRKKKKQ